MSEWRLIAGAPMDGSWFLGYRPKSKIGVWGRIATLRWDDKAGDFIWPSDIYDIYSGRPLDPNDCFEACGSFTHWMPLPEPPK